MPCERFSRVRWGSIRSIIALRFIAFGLILFCGSISNVSMTGMKHFGRRNLRVSNGSNETFFEIPELENGDIPLPLLAVAAPVTQPIAPYSLLNVLHTLPHFHDTFAIVIYDPPTDRFVLHYSTNMRWTSGCKKLVKSFKTLANSLRIINPGRFHAGAPEFALAISSGDYPGIKWSDCLLRQRSDCLDEFELAPVLQFGSTFRRALVPTMIGMPMPQKNHLSCYHSWAVHRQVCRNYLPRGQYNPEGLVFPESMGTLSWNDLVPQVVWRGTDFTYLHKMDPSLRQPDFEKDLAGQINVSEKLHERTAATRAMRRVYHKLLPRWKGVVWTAEAEREAEATNKQIRRRNRGRTQGLDEKTVLPWANIKFTSVMSMGQRVPTSDIEYYRNFQEYGIRVSGESMDLETLGQYRYHLDVGGGGGTTWSGTLEKLGLPGLLFHHVTPTKDYLHDRLQPWVHYVPVKADLSDLYKKFTWAENHPQAAQRISERATALAQSWGTPAGFDTLFREFFEGPLRRVVEAYRPLAGEVGSGGLHLGDAMAQLQLEGKELRPIIECQGYTDRDCESLVDDIQLTRS